VQLKLFPNISSRHPASDFPKMRVLFATSEMDDFVQVGGLAAVSAALPRALQKLCDIRVVIPGYREVLKSLQSFELLANLPAIGAMPAGSIGRGAALDGLPIYVVVCPELYDRPGTPYGDENRHDWSDNDVRFARFASAAAQIAAGTADRAWRADLVHCNDWPSALVPSYLAWSHKQIPTILTVHNLAYQGLFDRGSIGRIGAPDSAFGIEDMEFYGKVSFLKSGLIHASHLTTVSATYAREITTTEHGCGLEGVLRHRANIHELTGILNGIDESWDPRTCTALSSPFAPGDWTAKKANADHVREEFGLALSRGPLFALVARLVHQKGVDLVLAATEEIVKSGGQIIVTGRGEAKFERALQEAQSRNRENVAALIRFEDGEARRIFAGSDFTLMPSRFEPCGLSQMYAQRFGSLPIGRQTGGLSETIIDGKTGFLFPEPSASSLMSGISRALSAFGRKQQLNDMREHAMSQDFGWHRSARDYGSLYSKVAA
jgi:starch synthase